MSVSFPITRAGVIQNLSAEETSNLSVVPCRVSSRCWRRSGYSCLVVDLPEERVTLSTDVLVTVTVEGHQREAIPLLMSIHGQWKPRGVGSTHAHDGGPRRSLTGSEPTTPLYDSPLAEGIVLNGHTGSCVVRLQPWFDSIRIDFVGSQVQHLTGEDGGDTVVAPRYVQDIFEGCETAMDLSSFEVELRCCTKQDRLCAAKSVCARLMPLECELHDLEQMVDDLQRQVQWFETATLEHIALKQSTLQELRGAVPLKTPRLVHEAL